MPRDLLVLWSTVNGMVVEEVVVVAAVAVTTGAVVAPGPVPEIDADAVNLLDTLGLDHGPALDHDLTKDHAVILPGGPAAAAVAAAGAPEVEATPDRKKSDLLALKLKIYPWMLVLKI